MSAKLCVFLPVVCAQIQTDLLNVIVRTDIHFEIILVLVSEEDQFIYHYPRLYVVHGPKFQGFEYLCNIFIYTKKYHTNETVNINGITLSDIDECTSVDCSGQGNCRNIQGSFQCDCDTGYKISPIDPAQCLSKEYAYLFPIIFVLPAVNLYSVMMKDGDKSFQNHTNKPIRIIILST